MLSVRTMYWGCVLILLGVAVGAVEPDTVSLLQGEARGVAMKSRGGRNFHAFLGIPYAEPPVGALRFKAPEPPKPWEGVLNATQDGPLCIQKNYLDLKPQVQGQEDCLYLNVYTPNLKPEYLMDVMVYIHGGGFFAGTGASYLMGPQFLMDKDVVVVAMNYRLGVLGFLSTEDPASPGNYGFKDQVAALRWVQNNIAYLGGNPRSVTIFGQSAGAVSVHLHMLSPLSTGLFHKAISESGTALAPFSWPLDSLYIAKRQAEYVGCDPDTSSLEILSCLRNKDARELVDSGDKFKFWSVDPLDVFGPSVEQGPGAFLRANPFFLLKTGQFHRVPWMTGVVTDEGLVRVSAILANATLLEDLNRRLSVLGPRLSELSKSVPGTDQQVDYVWDRIVGYFMAGQNRVTPETERGFSQMFSDRSFIHGFHKSALLHQRAAHPDLYLYHFAYRGLYSFSLVYSNSTRNFGVSHADELIYLFNLPLIFPPTPEGHPDTVMSKKMVELWTNFAKSGKPTPEGSEEVRWEPVRPGEHLDYLEVSAGPNFTMKQDLFKARMDFWDSLPLFENNYRDTAPHHLIDLMYSYIVYLME